MKILAKILVILACSLGFVSQSMSWGLKDLDPTNKNSRLREGAKQFDPTRNPHFRNATGSSSVDFNLYNKCIRSNINVKVEYIPNNMRRFQTRHYHLRKNEKAFLFKTNNQYVYVTATSVDNKNRLNGLFKWDRQKVDTGRSSSFTQSFSCN